jgi:hypothetical protein
MDRWTDIQIEGRMQALGGGDGLGTPRPRLETMGAGAGAGERPQASHCNLYRKDEASLNKVFTKVSLITNLTSFNFAFHTY